MILLTHDILSFDKGLGTDIINPDHIVNMMSNNVESPHVEVEFVNRTSTINFLNHNDRDAFLHAVHSRVQGAKFKIKSLSNTSSRWV